MDLSDPKNIQIRYHPWGGVLVEAAALVDEILVDPVDPPDHSTRIEDRSKEELLTWWRLPYITTSTAPVGGYEVRCLDGGANDRPTFVGRADTIPEAVEIAKGRRPRVTETGVYVGP